MHIADLERRYEEYSGLPGDTESRLLKMGYEITTQLPSIEIDSIDAFKTVIMHIEFSKRCNEKMTIDEMTEALKLFYKTYMKKKDLLHLLKMGNSPFTEEEIQDAMKIMPIDVDGGILIDDLAGFMYK
ncbi:hypothetical protein PAEPH01_1792 [Pancytospora epiphaga]|nr:hypothetical protein PAEPH01_1792 [Pancytospora epiphaga]